MRKLSISLLLCWLISLAFSCERTLTDAPPDGETTPAQLIKEAQKYFTSQLAPNGQSARLGDGKDKWIKDKQPQWDKAETFKVDGKEVVEVPLLFIHSTRQRSEKKGSLKKETVSRRRCLSNKKMVRCRLS
jgi:hypothetical protein